MLGLLDILPPTGDKKDWKDVYIVSELMDTDLHYIIHSMYYYVCAGCAFNSYMYDAC